MASKILTASLKIIAIVCLLSLLFPSPVSAQSGPEPTTDIDHKAIGTLWDMYRGRTNIQKRQDKLLKKADRLEVKVQALIIKYQQRGYDVSPLEKALVDFQEQFDLARPLHEDAASWFSRHPGFSDLGNVIDIPLARITLKHILDDQVGVSRIMTPAMDNLQLAIRTYKRKIAHP